ncbi:MAG: hypothetical protein HC809_01130 [Gammaproteobacteria bacterium]|nr:hypothetical protein [Gammaproteobacteria bacterium]
MSADIRNLLTDFSKKFGVPAVAGGVRSSDGVPRYEVVGVRRRGSDDEAQRDDKWHIGSVPSRSLRCSTQDWWNEATRAGINP